MTAKDQQDPDQINRATGKMQEIELKPFETNSSLQLTSLLFEKCAVSIEKYTSTNCTWHFEIFQWEFWDQKTEAAWNHCILYESIFGLVFCKL